MPLKLAYDSVDDIPDVSEIRDLYTENNGVYTLTGVEGMKSQGDIDKVKEALANETRRHKETKEKFRPFADMDPESINEKLDKYDELEAQVEAGGGKIDDDKVNELVERRLATKMKPIQREMDQLKEANGELTESVDAYKGKETQRSVHDHIREAATALKMRPDAVDDYLMIGERILEVDEDSNVVARDNVGVTPGIDPKTWLADVIEAKPYLLMDSEGGGSRGGKGSGGASVNPWKKGQWSRTEQDKIITAKGTDYASTLAQSAGSDINAIDPPA